MAQNRLPSLEYVFEVIVPDNGDHLKLGFERAIYTVLFENAKDAGIKALEDKPLTEDELGALKTKLDDIKNVERDCLVLIIHGYSNEDAAKPFAQHYQIPVMFPTNLATNLLLGMSADRLKNEIGIFWEKVNSMISSDVNTDIPNNSGTENMQNSGFNINAHGGTVVVNTGSNSAAQAGNNNTANTGQHQSVDLAPLTILLNELQEAINELSSDIARTKFTEHLQTAQSELENKDKPNVGIFKQSLEAIKQGTEFVEGCERIVDLITTKALPLLSVLPSAF
jgi:hypothetical protein